MTAVLPGATLPLVDWVGALFWLALPIDLMVVGTSLFVGFTRGFTAAHGSMTLTLAVLMPMLLMPFLVLGAMRARGTRITVGLRWHGAVTYAWLSDGPPLEVRVRDLFGVSIPDPGPPSVALEVHREGGSPCTHLWRVPTRAHARWVVGRIEAAMAQQALGSGQSEEVPESMERLHQVSTERVGE